jgi:hypothetical protein
VQLGGGGGIRTCDTGLMSSPSWRSLPFPGICRWSVPGSHTPKTRRERITGAEPEHGRTGRNGCTKGCTHRPSGVGLSDPMFYLDPAYGWLLPTRHMDVHLSARPKVIRTWQPSSGRFPTAIGQCPLWVGGWAPTPRSRGPGGRRSPRSMPPGCQDPSRPRSTVWGAPGCGGIRTAGT